MVGSVLRGEAHSLCCVIFDSRMDSQLVSQWSLFNAPFLNDVQLAKSLPSQKYILLINSRLFKLRVSSQSFLCVLFTTGVLSRSLSSSSSSLDSRHGPGARPRPLPRQRVPARPRRQRVSPSPRTTPSPAPLRSSPDTAALTVAGLYYYMLCTVSSSESDLLPSFYFSHTRNLTLSRKYYKVLTITYKKDTCTIC